VTRLWPEGEAVEIWGEEAAPSGFVWQETSFDRLGAGSLERLGTRHRIEEITIRWRVHTRWWEPEQAVWREYVKVVTDTGLLCLLHRDLFGGGWFLARVYD
jgi:hypothetical protein